MKNNAEENRRFSARIFMEKFGKPMGFALPLRRVALRLQPSGALFFALGINSGIATFYEMGYC